MLKFYRKKPIVIKAIQWTGNLNDFKDLLGWEYHSSLDAFYIRTDPHTLEEVTKGHYVIMGDNEGLKFLSPEEFNNIYEEIPLDEC